MGEASAYDASACRYVRASVKPDRKRSQMSRAGRRGPKSGAPIRSLTQPIGTLRVYIGVVAVGGVRLDLQVDEPEAGDAFTVWVSPHLADLWRFAVSLAGVDAADDLVQECLARAWTKRDQFDGARGSARGWLFAIMADRPRRRWRRRERTPSIDRRELDPGASTDRATGRIDLRRAVDALPARQRTAVTLHYYLDLSVAEVADVMRCSVGTVKSTLHDARKRLGDELGGSYA